jgi:hypothetical protein
MSAMEKMNMLATECSYPAATKIVIGEKISMILAAALSARPAIQIARHTSQLHRIPRATSSTEPADILAETIEKNVWLPSPRSTPPPAMWKRGTVTLTGHRSKCGIWRHDQICP